MKLGLMIIDMQKASYSGASKESMNNACANINKILPLFRNKNLPILWVQDMNGRDNFQSENVKLEIIDLLEPKENEYRIYKKYWNSFNKTKCEEILVQNNVDTILITGYCAECCVLSTYRGAVDLDLTPIILKNGIASGNDKYKRFVEEISSIISTDVIMKIME